MSDTSLAMERGEIDGTCGWDWSSLKSMKPDWIKERRVNILFQVALKPDPELTAMGVPEVWKFLKTEEDRKVVELVASQQVFMRFFVAPPGTPPAQVSVLRTAFDTVMKDPEFLRDAERLQLLDQAPVGRSGPGSCATDVRHAQGHRRPHQARDQSLGRFAQQLAIPIGSLIVVTWDRMFCVPENPQSARSDEQ